MADVYDQLLDEQKPTTAPAAPAQSKDAYDTILDEFSAQQDKALQQSLTQALKVAPQQAATTQQLANASGLPQDVVERNKDAVQQQVKLRELQSLLAASPILARQMQDENFAKLAHSDANTLSTIERLWRGTSSGVNIGFGMGFAGIGDVANIVQRNLSEGFARTFLPTPIGGWDKVDNASLAGPMIGQDWQTFGNFLKAQGRQLEIPQLQQTFFDQVLAGVGQVASQVTVGALTGGGGSAAFLYGQGANAMTEKVQGDNASQGAKDLAVLGGAGVTALTEKWALDKLLGPMAVPIQNQLGAALTRIGIAGASEGAQETIESISQDALRQYLTNPDAEIQVGQAFQEGGVGATVGAIVRSVVEAAAGVRGRAMRQEQQASQAEQSAAFVEQLNKLAAASELLQTSPETFQQFIEAAAEDGGVQDVYIDAKFLMQSGMADQLAQLSPAVAQQLPTALATGGTVQIPVGEYAAKIAPTQFAQGLLDHIKTDPQGFSRAEVQEYYQNFQQQLEQEIAQQLDAKAVDQAFIDSKERVKQTVLTELNTLGRFTAQKNEVDAALIAARTAVRAAQLGMTPEAFFEQQRVRFAAQNIAGDSFNQDGQLQTDTPAFKNWFGDSKVANADGKPLVVYHGSGVKFNEFSKDLLGAFTGATSAKGGFFFTSSKALANQFQSEAQRKQAPYAEIKAKINALSDAQFVAMSKDAGDSYYYDLPYGDPANDPEAFAEARADVTRLMLDRLEQDNSTPYIDDRSDIDKVIKKYIGNEIFQTGDTLQVYLSLKNPKVVELEQGSEFQEDLITNAIAEAKTNGNDGVIIKGMYDSAAASDKGSNQIVSDIYIAFEPTQIKSATGNAGTFDPNNPNILLQNKQGPRGAFNPENNTIALLKNADLSTFLHEAGHYFFESDIALAAEIAHGNNTLGADTMTQGEREILADVSTLFNWLGINGDINEQLAQWYSLSFEEKRAYHEKTAESFERYLFEGKAPSIELQSYFQQFRAWLVNVYKSIKDFLARNPAAGELTDEVRAVFDRMLASTEEIQLAEQARSMMPLFRTQADADNIGMTAEEFRAYQSQDIQATNDAIQDLQARAVRDLQWTRNAHNREVKRLQRKAADLRAEARIEARAEVLQEPVYRAWQFLTRKLQEGDKITPYQRPKSDPNVVDPTIDSLFTTMAKLGGLNKQEAVETWGVEESERPNSGVFGKPVLRATGGKSIDGMAEVLAELGYLKRDENGKWDNTEFEEKFDEELRGNPQYSIAYDYGMDQAEQMRPGEGVNILVLGAGRLDLGALADMGFSKEEIELLKARKMTAKDGLHPDLVAELPGVEMGSGDELVRKLLEATPIKEEIDARTDALMLERHGELATPEAIAREADKAIHNEARAKMVATEANALAKATGERKILAKAAKQLAQMMVARIKIRDIKPTQYASAEARAAKNAEKAAKSGDLRTAAAEKRSQLVNTYATDAAYKAQDEINAALRYLRKFENEGSRKGLDVEYLDQIDSLLERFDLRKGQSLKTIDKRESLAKWIAAQEEQGIEPDLPAYITAEANRVHYKNLTVEEFRGLVDSVKQIEHLGRLKKKLLTAKDQRELDAIVDEISTRIEQSSGGRVVDNEVRNTVQDKLRAGFDKFMLAHRKAASLARELDGFQDGGPMWEYFTQSMNEAGDYEVTKRAETAQKLHELVKPILAGEKMGGKGRYFQTLDRNLNRGERLAIALNWGNDSNRQRLLGGKGWTAAQAQPVLDTLTAQEWQFVQGVWDLFESFRPEIAAKEKRVSGKEPDWIEATPLNITTADGQQLQLRGGYYPVKYDPRQSGRAGEHATAEEARQMLRAAYTASTTRRSFTKSRAEEVQGRPLLLSFDGIYQGMNEVIHDLAWHEWLIDANKLLRRLDGSIRTNYGADYVDALKKAVKDIAVGDTPAANAFESALSHVRNGSTIVGMGWNLITALLQPLGFTQSAVRIGPKWMARGLSEFFGTPAHMIAKAEEVQSKSKLMANRALTLNREINDVRNKLESSKSDTYQRVESTFFIMIQKMQAMVDYPTWLGAYDKALADPANDEQRAIALADQAVLDAQGGGQTKDLALIQRGGPLLKLFTNFYSYFNVLYNLTTEQTKKRVKTKEYGGLLTDYTMLMIVPAVLSAVLRNVLKGEDDEDKYAKDIAGELVGYPFGMFLGLREMAEAVKLAAGLGNPGIGYSGPAGLRFFSEVNKLGTQVGQGELDWALLKALNNTAGILFHYPAGQVNRLVEGTVELIDGKTSNPVAPLVGVQK